VLAGLKLLYFGAKFNVREDMWLDLMVAKAEAEAPMQGWDSDQGYEYDLTLNWDIYDNLNFRGVVAYLDAGDWWKGGDPTAQIEDTYTVYGALILSF